MLGVDLDVSKLFPLFKAMNLTLYWLKVYILAPIITLDRQKRYFGLRYLIFDFVSLFIQKSVIDYLLPNLLITMMNHCRKKYEIPTLVTT